jgi:signal transduction histidine kinase
MTQLQDLSGQWEQAYLRQSYDAAVGRLFKGLVHNLNGVLQVFSMQTDLFALMIAKGHDLVDRLAGSLTGEETKLLAAQLKELMCRREEAVRQMQEKVAVSREIMKRTVILPDFRQTSDQEEYTLNQIIRTEVEFLGADSFFKHKVKKNLLLEGSMPRLVKNQLELHQIVHFLLENALDALRGREAAEITVETILSDGEAVVTVHDSGEGIGVADQERIYEPFFTTRADHPGLGLYLARKLAAQCGGTLSCESAPGSTRFTLKLPLERV